MRFLLDIKMDNAAFHGEAEEDGDFAEAGMEVSRLLGQARTHIQNNGGLEPGDAQTLLDFNGNQVGGWFVDDKDHEAYVDMNGAICCRCDSRPHRDFVGHILGSRL